MKKTFIALMLFVLLFLIIIFSVNKSITTNKSENAKEITVNMYNNNAKDSIIFTDTTDLKEIMSVIQRTNKIKCVDLPTHSDSLQNDCKIDIEIIYTNNKKDTIYFSENKEKVYRFLKTKGSSGDSGYVIGNNALLYSFLINKISENNQH